MSTAVPAPAAGPRRPILLAAAVLAALAVIATVALPLLGLVALGDLLLPVGIAGAVAAALGAAGRSRAHLAAGIAAAAFPLLWFLIVVRFFGFV